MGNTNEGSQQGKDPENETSETSGSSQNVGLTSNDGSIQVSSGAVDIACGGDGFISSGGTETVVEHLDSELESTIEADPETVEKPSYLNAGLSTVVVNPYRNVADERIDGRGDVGVRVHEAGSIQEQVSKRHAMSWKTLSNGDEEEYRERLELTRMVGYPDSDCVFQNPDKPWRDSMASTMTDVSETYQTAGEDSDNEGGYNDEGDDDDYDDELRKTLCTSQLLERTADATSIGYVSLTGEDKLWEKEPNVEQESEEMLYVKVKDLPMKSDLVVTDKEDGVEIEKLEDYPHKSSEILHESDPLEEILSAVREDASAENQRVIIDDKGCADDVDGKVDNVVKGFDVARNRIDPENLEVNDLIDFESRADADASKLDDDQVTLKVSSVSLQLMSPLQHGSPENTTMAAEQDIVIGHTEQELPAENDSRHYKDSETSESGTDVEETLTMRPTEVASNDADYLVTGDRGDDDDHLRSPQINEHDVSSYCDAYNSSLHVVLVSNTEENDFQSQCLENQERGEGQIKVLEGRGIMKMKDEVVGTEEAASDNIHPFSSVERGSLGFGQNSFTYLSEQKDVDTVRSHTTILLEDKGIRSDESDSGSPACMMSLESSMPVDEDMPSSVSYSQEHEQNSSTLPADDSFGGISPSAYETLSESKSHEAFISDTREQGPRTKTTNDEDLSAEQMTFDSNIDSDASRRIEILSAGIKTEENEEEDMGGVSMTTIDNENEAEATGGMASAAENQSWSGGEEEPEPDYSLSSDDDQADDAGPDIKDLISFELSTAMRSDSPEHRDADVGDDALLPDYLDSVRLTKLQAEMHALSLSSTEPVSANDVNRQSTEQIPDNNETIDSRTVDFESWEDDEDNSVPLGNFQRKSSIRPSRRSHVKSKRSVAIPPSWSEHPEEEGGDFSTDTPGTESVFLPLSADTLTIPHSARFDRGPLSVPVMGKDHEKELWTKSSQDTSGSMTSRSDGDQSHKSRFSNLERRNATRTNKTDVPFDEKEWTKYEVVLRKQQGGFGITLSHSSPVVVHKVQEDGVAAKSGIREGDRIHKVDGTLVASCSHEEVISMIKMSGLFIVLVLQRPSSEIRDHPVPMTPSITENSRLSRLSKSSISSTKSVGGISLISSRMSSPPETPDVSYDGVPKPFTDLNLLKQKPAHLAVFLNYLLMQGKSNAMLFTLIADCYQTSLKESTNSARRWAYEIYSTFLMSSAPLKLTVDDGMEASVEKILQKAATNGLLSLFVPITNLVRNEIVCQLKEFVVTWKSGERYRSSDYSLRTMNMDRQLEFQVIEGTLWKHFEHCLSEERNDTKHAVAYSLATFFRQIGYSGARNSNLLENCPTFMSKDKKALKNKMKKHFAHKGHQFSPRQFAAVTQCQLCQKVIWGLGHQAYHCSSCDLSIHRHCTEKIIDVCGRTKDSKRSMRDMIPGRKPQNSIKEELQKNFFLPPFMTDPDDLRNLPMTPVDHSNGPEYERLQPVCSSDDSDLDVDSELPQLTDFIPKEELRQMKEKEKKRLQIINELFHTERNHVRALKVMDKVFLRPMQEDSYIDQEFVSLLFPNLQDLIQIHDSLKKAFVAAMKEKNVVDKVGLLLISKFSGSHGEKFKEACAKFCADQSYALNVLRKKQRKDPKYSTFLQEAAASTLCKRQELKDFLPREMQRLSKYPLLIDSLRKNTSANTEEHGHLTGALELSKDLLKHVNQVVKSVENQRHLADMQQRLDWRSMDASSLGKYRFLNLTKHKLVYDGEVTWRPNQSRPIELHMVLFEDILVLLQKQDERLVLRCQMTTVEDAKFPYCPILKLNSLMIRDVATDKCAFFVVDSDSVSPQVYDLRAHCREEKNKWCSYIEKTIEGYLGIHGPYRGGRNRSATQVIDLVSYSKSERSPALTGDSELRPHQANDSRSASCHVLTSYDSPDQSATGINVQQVISRLTSEESFGATKLSNIDACDNDDKDECRNIVEGTHSEAAALELVRRLEEVSLCINQMMREKRKLLFEDPNTSSGDDDGSFQGSDVHTLDAKELVRMALARLNNLMDLINEQLGNTASSPDSSQAEEKKIAVPADDLLNISATLQHLMAQLAMRVTMDVAELEKLEEDFRVALDDLKEKSSAIHPDDLASSSSCTNFGSSASENAFFPTASQTNIYTVFNEDQPTLCDYHDQSDSANSDLPTEESRTAVLVDQD